MLHPAGEKQQVISVRDSPQGRELPRTYLLMSLWFIGKGTFSQPLSWRSCCVSQLIEGPGLPARLLVGCLTGPQRRGVSGLHKHGAQSAGIALHSQGPSPGWYRGSLFWALALFNTITTAPFSPDLLPFFYICICCSLGCRISTRIPSWMGKLIWRMLLTTKRGVHLQCKNVDLRNQHKGGWLI